MAAAPLEQRCWETSCDLIDLEPELHDDEKSSTATKARVAAIIATEKFHGVPRWSLGIISCRCTYLEMRTQVAREQRSCRYRMSYCRCRRSKCGDAWNQGSLSGRARGSIDRSDRGAQSDCQRNRSNRFRARAEARDKRGISRPQGRATRPTARLADWHQGPPRDRRAADNLRLAPLSRPRARTRCGHGRACTQGGRDHSLQDQRAGIWSRREYAQPRVGRDRKSL